MIAECCRWDEYKAIRREALCLVPRAARPRVQRTAFNRGRQHTN
jgi:hypothetical protein